MSAWLIAVVGVVYTVVAVDLLLFVHKLLLMLFQNL